MTNLNGKAALITGGSRGVGAATAKALAAQGAFVTLTYAQSAEGAQNLVQEIEAAGGKAQAVQADNRDEMAMAAAVEAATKYHDGLDVLVNNAGIFNVGPFEELDAAAFDQTISVNVRGVYLITQAAVKKMNKGGRIITIGSNLAVRVPGPGMSLYAMSKAALIGLTKALAREYGAREIAANIIHPGSTDTDMNPADGPFSDAQRSLMAIPRYNQPTDVANMVTWLAGSASPTITGAEFTIDSGTNI